MNRGRTLEIDGMRGWASFSVLLYHAFHEMLMNLLPWLNNAWLAPLIDGRLAVCVFFVLSGDALSSTFFSRGASDPRSIDTLVVRRYARLTIPILMSCAIVFAVRISHADYHLAANAIVDRPEWLGEFIPFDFSLLGLFKYSLIGVYASHTKLNSYNPFLWTMSVEMVGSMLVFIMCYLWPRIRNAKAVLVFLAVVLFALGTFFSLFFVGMLFGLLRHESFYVKFIDNRKWQFLCPAVLSALALLPVATSGQHVPLQFDLGIAAALVFLFYSHRGLRSMMRSRLSRWIGDISFPIYLVQFAVIISLESWLLVIWNSRHGSSGGLVMIGACTVLVTVLVAWLFRQLERLSLRRVDVLLLRILQGPP